MNRRGFFRLMGAAIAGAAAAPILALAAKAAPRARPGKIKVQYIRDHEIRFDAHAGDLSGGYLWPKGPGGTASGGWRTRPPEMF